MTRHWAGNCALTSRPRSIVRHKNDGTLPESTKGILRGLSLAQPQERKPRLVQLIADMLANADVYAAGQPLTLKATTPMARLDEALDYLVQNTFTKMGYLKQLSTDPLKELQAILRCNDIGQQTLGIEAEDGNKQAIDEVRSFVDLSTAANRQIVLHDMIEKRYSLRPYGWANPSSWSASGWNRSTRAWAKCKPWPWAWAI